MTGKEDSVGQELTMEEWGNLTNNPSCSLLLSWQKWIHMGGSPRPPSVAWTSAPLEHFVKGRVPEKENLKSQTSNRFALDMMRRFGRDGPGCLGQMFSTSFKALPFVFSAEWSNPQAEEGPACEAWTNFSHKRCGFILFILLCVPFQKKMKAPRFKGKCKKPFWGKYKGGLHRPPKLPLSLMMMNFKKLTHHLCIPQPFLECSDVSSLVLGMIIQKGMRYSPCPEGLQLEKQVNHVSKDTNENLWIYASKTVPRVGRMLSQE